MSIEIKNTKSATEKVIDNAGITTGPKKSEYKFNDVTVVVPGTNLQVKIPPQESHTFDANASSFAGIALNQVKGELGLNDSGDTPTPPVPPTPSYDTVFSLDFASGTGLQYTGDDTIAVGKKAELNLSEIPDVTVYSPKDAVATELEESLTVHLNGEDHNETELPVGQVVYRFTNVIYVPSAEFYQDIVIWYDESDGWLLGTYYILPQNP